MEVILRSFCYRTLMVRCARKYNSFNKILTSDQVEQYREEGYTVVKNLLSEEELKQTRVALDELKERSIKSFQAGEKSDIYEVERGADGKQILNRIRFPCELHETFYNLQRHDKILDCVEDLIGPSFRYIAQDKLNLKPACTGAAVRWHQDWAFFPHTNDSVLTASILLHDTTRSNGCLQIVPGTHKGPILSHYFNNTFANVITDKKFKPNNLVYLEAPAGSLTLHNARVVHGSAKNTSNQPRSTLCFVFTAMDAWPLLGVGGRDFMNSGPVDYDLFTATLLRGNSCFTPRMENIPVSLPIPFHATSSVFKIEFETADEPAP
ncbi:probable alpha-ketoglutarate-dependent hypophosphite dioxygenase isoform X2 [Hydra vulgaris]|uniref:Probable alpha-ketoglutarate-dependent hypophosphite dioxygenase isoform X2 n=1 Tax=Hydra vulgaris TaxID=6087 RepID=A0ABM4BGV3_HYDVU